MGPRTRDEDSQGRRPEEITCLECTRSNDDDTQITEVASNDVCFTSCTSSH